MSSQTQIKQLNPLNQDSGREIIESLKWMICTVSRVPYTCSYIHFMKTLVDEWPYLFRNLDGAVGEGDALAEALCAAGHSAVPGDADVLSMDLVEEHRRQVVCARLAARVARGCNRTPSFVREV